MISKYSTYKWILIVCSIFFLFACKHGEDKKQTSEQLENTPPTISFNNISAQAISGDIVALSATVTDIDGVVTGLEWSQVAGNASMVENNKLTNTSFLVANVTQEMVFTFRLTATDDDGAVTSKNMDILVLPNPASNNPAALVLSNTLPVGYVWTKSALGLPAYQDRNFSYITIPNSYLNLDILQTRNADKLVSKTEAVSFFVNKSVYVYVAYDSRLSVLPSWLQSWSNTGANITTSDSQLVIYEKKFAAGAISLGGNYGVANSSMYTVLVSADKVTNGSGNLSSTLGVDDISFLEGSAADITVNFTVSLSAIQSNTVTVQYVTQDGSATSSNDFQAVSGELVFLPGETSKMVNISIVADSAVEKDEVFKLFLFNALEANIGNATGVATILNDDSTTNLPTLSINNANLLEGDSGTVPVLLTVTLSRVSAQLVTVNYSTRNITAVSPVDYQKISAEFLTFNPGEVEKNIIVLVSGDTIPEVNETLAVELSNPSNATIAVLSGTLTILNDDASGNILLVNPGPQVLNEEEDWILGIIARPTARIFVANLPPGAHWDEVNRNLSFRPDFIQGGGSWVVTMEAIDGAEVLSETFTISVNNNIQPPWPTKISTQDMGNAIGVSLSQVTDDFLDSLGNMGRSFTANISIPKNASASNILPLQINMHGFGGGPGTGGYADRFYISPHDPENTWWTGYSELQPNGASPPISGTIPNYTQRRVMHLLDYVIQNYVGVNTDRVWVSGTSMGGTGAFFMSIRYARHFSELRCSICGTYSSQLEGYLDGHWGSLATGLPNEFGMRMYSYTDSSRAAIEDKDFRNMFITTYHAENDTTIAFVAVVGDSPVSGVSLRTAVNDENIGHFMIWDQHGHSFNGDPVLGSKWWSSLDAASYLQRNLPFPAFSDASSNADPGVPDGVGGYTGVNRGGINRYFRWNSEGIVDSRDSLIIPIKLDIDTTGTPTPGLPPTRNLYFGSLPITANVTIRRIQSFQTLPGEVISWSFNGASGTVAANTDGSISVPGLSFQSTSYSNLLLTRP